MELRKKIAFVVNPTSGTQSKGQIIELVDQKIDRTQYDPVVMSTQFAGHAAQIAGQCARDGFFAVVAVGGDGTVNEVAGALVHTDCALGIIPCGSGNGLARDLQISRNPRKAIDTINYGETTLIDYGTINGQKFFCTCGVGFDAFVSLKFATSGKRGSLSYIEQALKESLSYKPETYELTIDGNSTTTHQAYVIACANAAQYGNNAYIAPHATNNDGLLDVTILRPFTPLEIPSLALQLFTKTIDQNSHVQTTRCHSIHIKRHAPGVIHFDGEPMNMDSNLDVTLTPLGLRVLIPVNDDKEIDMIDRAQGVISELKQHKDNILSNMMRRNKAKQA